MVRLAVLATLMILSAPDVGAFQQHGLLCVLALVVAWKSPSVLGCAKESENSHRLGLDKVYCVILQVS